MSPRFGKQFTEFCIKKMPASSLIIEFSQFMAENNNNGEFGRAYGANDEFMESQGIVKVGGTKLGYVRLNQYNTGDWPSKERSYALFL